MKLLISLLLITATLCNVIDVNSNEELWHWLCNGTIDDSSQILFSKASYTLASPGFCIIQSVNNITLRSVTGHSSIYCSPKKKNGFGFINITNITVAGIDFNGCGSTVMEEVVVLINDTHPHIGFLQKAVLLFNHCKNINISHISVTNYYGYAIMLFNPFGFSTLYDVFVAYGIGSNDKSCLSDATFSCAGSGIMCAFKDTSLKPKDPVIIELVKITIRFSFNIIHDIPPLEGVETNLCKLPLIGAAGLSVLFSQSYEAGYVCKESTIGDGCGGTIAGNVFILYTNGMYNSKIVIANTHITGGYIVPNWRDSKMNQEGGSGINVISVVCSICGIINGTWSPLNILKSYIAGDGSVDSFSTKSNIHYGGGIYLNILDFCDTGHFVIQLTSVLFSQNYAKFSGSNLYAFMSKKAKNSKFSFILKDNEVLHSLKVDTKFAAYSTVPGITLINWNNVTINGGLFHDNNATVIAAYNSEVFITGNIMFLNNKGPKGTAFLLQSSYLILQEPLNATFINNVALLYGGAVYVNNQIIPRKQQRCGMQIQTEKDKLSNLSIHLNLCGSTAGLAGKALYINQLYNCLKFYNQQQIISNSTFSWKSIVNFNFGKCKASEGIKAVSAEPFTICSCIAKGNIVYPVTNVLTSNDIYTYPGMVIQLSLCALDASGNIVYSPAIASIVSIKYNKYRYEGPVAQDYLYLKQEQRPIPLSGTDVTVVHYSIYNRVSTYVHALLSIATPNNPPTWSANVHVLSCPLGFILNDDQCICDPFITQTSADTKCNITNTSISISFNQWLGNISNTLGFSFLCPPGNCKSLITHVNVTDPLSICQDSKEGVLCGQCRAGLSVVFGTTQCMPCPNLWLLSLIGYAISGVILVVIMLYLPLTISDGPLASIVIAMNLTAVSTIDLLKGEDWYLYVTRVCVSIVNLSLGFPLCLYNGMTPVVKTGLVFVYPVYLWLLMIMFIIFSHYSTRVSNRTATHSVQVLATLLYLSFSKILMNIIDIIAFIPVHTSHNGTVTVWYGDGSIKYLSISGGHIILFLLSVVLLCIFVLPFIMFVTFGGYCLKWWLFNKYLRQFLEAFQGQYKDGKGYLFGVKILVLTYVYLMWGVLRGYNLKLMLFSQLVPISILCAYQLYLKPYRSILLNKVDILCLTIPLCQMLLVISFSNTILRYVIVVLNMFVFAGLFTLTVCQVRKKIKRKNRTTHHEVQALLNDEDTDEMRKFLSDIAKELN